MDLINEALPLNFSKEANTPDPEFQLNFIIFIISVFSLIILFGVVSNGLLIFIVATNKSMHTVPNILLVNVAIGDLLMVSVSAPLRMLLYVYVNWMYGTSMCHLFEFVIKLSEGISIFTFTALAGDRFGAIVLLTSAISLNSKKKAFLTSVSLWILAFLFALPDLITSDIVHTPSGITFCSLYAVLGKNMNNDYHPYIITRRITNFFVYFVIPFIIIMIFYVSMAVSLARSAPSKGKDSLCLSKNKIWNKQLKSRKKIARIILVISFLFLVCWLPRYLYIFIAGYSSQKIPFSQVKYFKAQSFIFLFFNSCVNVPSLYIMSSDFKRYLNHYICGLCCKSKRLKRKKRASVTEATQYTINPGISLEDMGFN